MIYAQHFERFNYNHTKPLEEKVCVIFETDIPHENETLDEFEVVMWNALWEQYPLWECPYNASKQPPNMFEKWRHGFSSVMMVGPTIKL